VTGVEPRLFLAAEIPSETAAAFHAAAVALADRTGGRAVPSENLHVTVRFLGAVPRSRLTAVAAAVRALTGARAPRLTVTGLVGRPRAGRARLIAAELADAASAVMALRDDFATRLPEGGVAGERPAWPHVTLVRHRREVALGSLPNDLLGLAFTCPAAVLYESIAVPGGPPRYLPVERAPLSPE
jgi:2'-5' RNA ligase